MKKTVFFLLVLFLGSAGVQARVTNTQYTTIDQLTSNYFVMTVSNGTWYLNVNDGHNAAWGSDVNDIAGSTHYYLFKAQVEKTENEVKYYSLNVYNTSGEAINRNGGCALSPYTYGYFVGACSSPSYGGTQYDPQNNALWTIEVEDGKFAFKSASNGENYCNKYLQPNAAVSDTKSLWTCYDQQSFIDYVSTSDNAVLSQLSDLTDNTFIMTLDNEHTPYTYYAGVSCATQNLNWGAVTTGINTVNGEGLKVDGYYNLAGQRISQPVKGQIYIKNGRKYIAQ